MLYTLVYIIAVLMLIALMLAVAGVIIFFLHLGFKTYDCLRDLIKKVEKNEYIYLPRKSPSHILEGKVRGTSSHAGAGARTGKDVLSEIEGE